MSMTREDAIAEIKYYMVYRERLQRILSVRGKWTEGGLT